MSSPNADGISGASPPSPERAALLIELEDVLRLASGQGVMLSEAIAKRLGINPTDLECLGLLEQYGLLTAGRLAELTGLTTGAITGLIDRLERRGFVERERDPGDRRRVIVRLLPNHLPSDLKVYDDMSRGMDEVCARYSDDELRTIIDFMRRGFDVAQAATAKMLAIGER